MVRKRNPNAVKYDHRGLIAGFYPGCAELTELFEPIDPGNEIAVVKRYNYLEEIMKKLVESGSNLVDLLGVVGATQEVADVSKEIGQGQRWLEDMYRRIGIEVLTRKRDDDVTSNTKTSNSLSSEQKRRANIAAKKVDLWLQEKVAKEELRIETQRKQVQIRLERLRCHGELEVMQAVEEAHGEDSARGTDRVLGGSPVNGFDGYLDGSHLSSADWNCDTSPIRAPSGLPRVPVVYGNGGIGMEPIYRPLDTLSGPNQDEINLQSTG